MYRTTKTAELPMPAKMARLQRYGWSSLHFRSLGSAEMQRCFASRARAPRRARNVFSSHRGRYSRASHAFRVCSVERAGGRPIECRSSSGGRICAVGTTALRTLESAADDVGYIRAFEGDTNIFISPGYRFRAVDMLITNFHLPKSTLFMLVGAFMGFEKMQRVYTEAIEQKY